MALSKIQPSQLYISEKKLASIKEKITKNGTVELDPIPIKKLGEDVIYTDGHTRAFLAYQKGDKEITVEWDDDELDWEMYEICVQWCKDEKIFSIADLQKRIVPHKKYEVVWYKRCKTLHTEIALKRAQK
ncbi:MAG: hypothetical protein ACTSQ0_05130 [Candidatus Heimdallarchaeota archaeon]